MRFRCTTAVAIALSALPRYRELPWVRESMEQTVRRALKSDLDATLAPCLSAAAAKSILEAELPRILRAQRANGRWKIRDSERLSYALLKALKHAGLLDALITERRFRCDPFLRFIDEEDHYSLAVRCNVIGIQRKGDIQLRTRLANAILADQQKDGSWNHTVISTVLRLQRAGEIGLCGKDARIARAASWLLTTCQATVVRQVDARIMAGVTVGHHMFCSGSREAEFRSAVEESPQWSPVCACYMHLPMIQTGMALKTLIDLGYADDARVIAACENLVELRQRFGGWCDTRIRDGLVAERRTARDMTLRR